jgi:hypothetical protein
MDWLAEVQVEMDNAEQARAKGNEGKARVCARRAAGIAAREFLARQGLPARNTSVYDLLNLVAQDAAAPSVLRNAAVILTLRVDEEFRLPPNVDLIAEAREFCTDVASLVNK